MAYLKQIAIAIDQVLNALVGGWADETLSSHAWRMEQQRKPAGFLRIVIDRIFSGNASIAAIPTWPNEIGYNYRRNLDDLLNRSSENMDATEPGTKECQDHMRVRMDAIETAMRDDLKDIKDSIGEVKEILQAWNSIKGFGTTMRWLAGAIKIMAIVGGTVGVVWYAFQFGHLPPGK